MHTEEQEASSAVPHGHYRDIAIVTSVIISCLVLPHSQRKHSYTSEKKYRLLSNLKITAYFSK